ncbi:MAG: hypothetical protein LBU56_04620 [Rickettsiales bacterium]|jgi:hypothetical protein|nr:hypothetical protein [Rickettsiales bacterium]
MNVENIQQEHSYHEFIQNFLFLSKEIKEDGSLPLLFDEIKKESRSIYNAVVDFNIVKFSIEYDINRNKSTNWDKKEAYEVLRKELDKTKEAAQKLGDKAKRKLESEVQKRLKDYIESGVKEDGVKIYGNHASIMLEDNKKEFKISEFLNSDFCQKNGISGFSTLHGDGKSGMHGFVAEEGGRKIRHYVVTDGSYEMTLNWYVNGEKCTVTINIDKDGIDLIEPNGVTEQLKKQLEANKDVKIGGLFLHQIQFREKGKGQENEVQKDSQSSETFIGSNSQNVSVQVHFGPQSNGRRQSYDSGIGKDFDDKINSQEAEEKRKLRQAAREENSGDKVYNLQSLFEENSQNKKTPPPSSPRTSSLPSKKGLSYQNDRQSELSSNATDIAQKQFIENVLEKIEEGKRYDPIRNWLKDKIEGKENNQNLDSLEEKLSKKYSQGNIVEKGENDSDRLSSPVSTGGNMDVEQSSDTQLQKNSRRNGKEPEEEEMNFQKISKALGEWKENRRNARQSNSSSSSPIHASHDESQVNPKQLKASLINVEQSDDTLLTEFTSKLDKETQKFPLRPVTQKGMSEQTRERLLEAGLLKDDSTDMKTAESTAALESTTKPRISFNKNGQETEKEAADYEERSEALKSWKRKRLSKYGISEDVKETSFNAQEKAQSNHANDLTSLKELKQRLSQKSYGLKQVNPKARYVSSQTRKHLIEAGMLKDSSADIKTVTEQENSDTNLTIDKNSELSKLLARDEEQLKTGVIEAEREDTSLVEHTNSHDRNRIALANRNRKLLWTEHVAKQQAKETKDILR